MPEGNHTITEWSAARIATAVQNGDVSPVTVAMAHLDRIRAEDTRLGAFQTVREDQSIHEAEQLARRPDLHNLSLAGVPVAIKDCVDVEGEPTRYGSAASDPAPAAADDELVRRLRDAGAIIIGKTRLPELAIWPFTESQAFGDTRNPWNTSLTPGGSSGGSAAAVASRMVPLALGSDGGGSVRIPAACCGLVGLKPAPGVVPLAGGLEQHWFGMSAYGPLGRSVEDLGIMFRVLSGSDSHDDVSAPSSSLRIAISTRSPAPGGRVDKQVRAAVEALGARLASAGHIVVEADPPYPVDFPLRFMRRWLPGIAEDAENMNFEALEPRTRSMVRAGRWLQRRGWQKPIAEDAFGATMVRWLGDFDVLLTPTLASTAAPVGKWERAGWIRTALSVSNWICTSPWNLAGLPAASVPAGLSQERLPIGAQLVAAPGQEELLLSLMLQIEQLSPWATSPD